MMMKQLSLATFFTFLTLFMTDDALPCSMFKITLYGKTMVGNNEDAWRLNSRIWFEKGREGHFGAAYVGHDDGFPQGGFNEAGLAYDGFTVYRRTLRPATAKLKIENPTIFLQSILQQCATVEEVRRFVNRYDRSRFNGSMLLFVDKSGNYLVVEADTTLAGHEEKYVLSNFCPSLTAHPEDVKIGRYQRGRAFLQDRADTSLQFCRSVMDTMHECRARLGDDFQHKVSFNLQQELAKGDHSLLMTALFPPNTEYIRFTHHKTPFNNPGLRTTLSLTGLFFLFTLPCCGLIYLRELRRGAKTAARSKTSSIWLLLLAINLGLAYYVYQLLSNKAIFYFDAPYKEEGNRLLNLSSWFPLSLLLLFLPVGFLLFRAVRQSQWNKLYLSLSILNLTSYIFLLVQFGYWGLYL